MAKKNNFQNYDIDTTLSSVKVALTSARRSIGQLRRHYGVDVDLSGVTTKRQIQKAREKAEAAAARVRYERREEEKRREKEKEEKKAELEISNMRAIILQATQARTTAAAIDMEFTATKILQMIDAAVDLYGPITVADRLRPYATQKAGELTELIRAIYSEYYNTNTYAFIPDKPGEVGRRRYTEDLEKFGASLGLSEKQMDSIIV